MKINLIINSQETGTVLETKIIKAIKKTGNKSTVYKYIDDISRISIEIFENSVIIKREGKVRSEIVLKKGINTSFNYLSQYMNANFNLFTKNLEILVNGLKVSYVISQNGNFINEINLSIIEK